MAVLAAAGVDVAITELDIAGAASADYVAVRLSIPSVSTSANFRGRLLKAAWMSLLAWASLFGVFAIQIHGGRDPAPSSLIPATKQRLLTMLSTVT